MRKGFKYLIILLLVAVVVMVVAPAVYGWFHMM